jgi:predicted RNA-binding Zn-ribbon protein involved in translation (DUF1610 family)
MIGLSLSEPEMRVIEEIEEGLDELSKNLFLFTNRLGRLRLEKSRMPASRLLRHKVYSALNIMSYNYPRLWIDALGIRFLAGINVSQRHLNRILNEGVNRGLIERSQLRYTFRNRHPNLMYPALKVPRYGLLCASYKDGKPLLIVKHFERRKFPHYVYRGRVDSGGVVNVGIEGIMFLLKTPLFLKDIPINTLVSDMVGDGNSNLLIKATIFMVKSGRLERFRKELVGLGLRIIHYLRQNKQACEELVKFVLELLNVRPRLDTLMVKCGIRRIASAELHVDKERLMTVVKLLLEHLPNETSFKPEPFHFIINDWCEALEKIRPEFRVYNDTPYLACPMCGYQITVKKDRVRALYENFECNLCGYKPPDDVKVYYCEKCEGPVPVTDSLISEGRTRCLRCFQIYPLKTSS